MTKVREEFTEDLLKKAVIDIENQRLKKRYGEKILRRKSKPLFKNIAWFSLAACLLGSMIILWKWNSPNISNNTATNLIAALEIYEDPMSSMRGADPYNLKKTEQAINLMRQGKLTPGIDLLKNVSFKELPFPEQYILSQAYLKLGKSKKAEKILDHIINQKHDLYQEARWLKAVLLLSKDRKLEARSLVSEIIENKEYNWETLQTLAN